MIHTVTMQKLEEMKFTGFARAYREVIESSINREFTTDELIAHLVQAEWDDRYNRKLQRLITNARFRYRASFEEIDFSTQRNLDKNQLLRLSSCDWITKHQNIIITGATGSGKSLNIPQKGGRQVKLEKVLNCHDDTRKELLRSGV